MDPSVSRVLCQKKGQFCTGNFWFISIRRNFGADTRDNIAMKCCTRAWILLNYLQPRLEPSTSWLIGRCCESKAPLALFEREREKKSIDFFPSCDNCDLFYEYHDLFAWQTTKTSEWFISFIIFVITQYFWWWKFRFIYRVGTYYMRG